ncbi:uncharacterized protein LOC110862441 [Folsomia candida]|uniref:uncharacterized protein LOC110862441 n=1 Tax=Folsomia candida TaxID=158441 RepID=UPI000B90785E|nr:uncharacterized protein LOC110862441 [Folsomia candida]
MKTIVLVLVALAAIASAKSEENPGRSAPRSRPNYDDVTYYNCAGKPDGNYLHPFDCTRFITCHNGRTADMACGDCDMNNVNGCQGSKYLVYLPAKDWCEWPKDADCHAWPTDVTTDVPPPVTTPKPDEPTTPENPDSTASPAPCRTLVPGNECNPFKVDCNQCDWCANRTSHYFFCKQDRDENPFKNVTGVWVSGTCAEGYLIDRTKPLTGSRAGGQCTKWDELDDKVKEDYFREKECDLAPDVCEYTQKPEEKCTKKYSFQKSKNSEIEDGYCRGVGDVFDLATENCRPCSDLPDCTNRGDCTK